MNFYNFMMKNYRQENGAKGSLAFAIHNDREDFPRNGVGKFSGWRKILRDYLERHRIDDSRMKAFEECWEEYVQCEKEKARLRRNSSKR